MSILKSLALLSRVEAVWGTTVATARKMVGDGEAWDGWRLTTGAFGIPSLIGGGDKSPQRDFSFVTTSVWKEHASGVGISHTAPPRGKGAWEM